MLRSCWCSTRRHDEYPSSEVSTAKDNPGSLAAVVPARGAAVFPAAVRFTAFLVAFRHCGSLFILGLDEAMSRVVFFELWVTGTFATRKDHRGARGRTSRSLGRG